MLTAENIKNLNPKNLRKMFLQGISVKWIAEMCGVDEDTIYNRFKEYKIWNSRRGSIKKITLCDSHFPSTKKGFKDCCNQNNV